MLVDNVLTSGQKKALDLNPCEVHTATLLLTCAALVTIAGAISAKAAVAASMAVIRHCIVLFSVFGSVQQADALLCVQKGNMLFQEVS